MFITNREANGESIIKECEERFPQFRKGKFYVLRSEVKAFNQDDEEGRITLDGRTGVLLGFDSFNEDGNAWFFEPVFQLQPNGSLSEYYMLGTMRRYQNLWIPAEELANAVIEPFDFEKTDFSKADDAAMCQAYNKARSRTTLMNALFISGLVLMFALIACGIFFAAVKTRYEVRGLGIGALLIALVFLCGLQFIMLSNMGTICDNIKEKVFSRIYKPYECKRIAVLQKCAENLGIDPFAVTFTNNNYWDGIRLSKAGEASDSKEQIIRAHPLAMRECAFVHFICSNKHK